MRSFNGKLEAFRFATPPSFPFKYRKPVGGFLYLHAPPASWDWAPNPLTHELRFRVTNDADPASFAAGRDLQFGGLPWGNPLLFRQWTKPGVRYLVAKDDCALAERFNAEYEGVKSRRRLLHMSEPDRTLLYAFGQPFRLTFSQPYNHQSLLYRRPRLSTQTTSANWDIDVHGREVNHGGGSGAPDTELMVWERALVRVPAIADVLKLTQKKNEQEIESNWKIWTSCESEQEWRPRRRHLPPQIPLYRGKYSRRID